MNENYNENVNLSMMLTAMMGGVKLLLFTLHKYFACMPDICYYLPSVH